MKKVLFIISLTLLTILPFSSYLNAQGCVEATSEDGPQLVGYIQPQFDYYSYGKDVNFDNEIRPSSFYFQRARVGVVGSIPYDISYYVMAEFSPIWTGYPYLLDAFVTYAPLGKYFKVSMGQFKQPFSLELNTPCFALHTVNRSLVVNQLAGPFRELGIMFLGAVGKERDVFTYKVGVLNGTGINKFDNNANKALAGRLTVAPWEFITIGGSARYELVGQEGIEGQPKKTRYAGDLTFEKWNFRLQGEYIVGTDTDKEGGGGSGGGGCGGKATNAGLVDFNKSGFWVQAMYMTSINLQPVIKYESYDSGDTEYSYTYGPWVNEEVGPQNYAQSTVTIGLNYFLNDWTRIQVNYLINNENGNNASGTANEFKNNALLIQVQAKF